MYIEMFQMIKAVRYTACGINPKKAWLRPACLQGMWQETWDRGYYVCKGYVGLNLRLHLWN